MNYGLYISASGMIAGLHRQDVWANNLANLDTAGFKADYAAARQRDVARVEDRLGHLPSDALMERLGAGVLAHPTRTSFVQGSLIATGRNLDVGIEGEGFLAVSTGAGGSEDSVRFTRDGRLTLDPDGRLVMAGTGHPVLDDQDRPIRVRTDMPLSIAHDGTVEQGGRSVARIALVGFDDTSALRKSGSGLFAADMPARRPATGGLRAGHLEDSAVNEIEALMRVTAAASAAQLNAGMIQYHDRLMERAINTLGRVS